MSPTRTQPTGPRMGNVADLERQRGAGDRQGGRVLLLIGGDDGGDQLDIVAEVLGEERSHRPVDHPAGDDGRLAGPPLTAGEAARDWPAAYSFSS